MDDRPSGLQRPSERPSRLLVDEDSPYTQLHEQRQRSVSPSVVPNSAAEAMAHDKQAQRGFQEARQHTLAREWNTNWRASRSARQSPVGGRPISTHSSPPRSVRLLPANEWNQVSNNDAHSSHDEVANPSVNGVQNQSPLSDGAGFIQRRRLVAERNASVSPSWSSPMKTFLTPGDSKTMHIQVKELEGEVASLAYKLWESQEESSRLRKALEQERNRYSHMSSDYEKHLGDQMRDSNKSRAEVLSCKNEISDLRTAIIDLQADIVYKDLQRTKDVLELSGRHAMMAWKGHVREMRRRLRVSCRMWVRKMMSRLLWFWRIASSRHVALLTNYAHRLLEVCSISPAAAPFTCSLYVLPV